MKSKQMVNALLRSMGLGLLAALVLAGCALPGSSGGGGGNAAEGNVDLTPTLSALYLQSVWGDGALQRDGSPNAVLTGALRVVHSSSGEESEFFWSIYLNGETLDVQSNATVILTPGDYDFYLLVSTSGGDQQYAGSSLLQTIEDGENTVPLTLRPVIGDTVTDVSVVAQLADFRFSYNTDELAGYADPALGVVVDDGSEAVYSINPALGLTDAYVNLPLGWHDLRLRFYSAATLRGRSVPAQETVFVEPGVDLVMDLVALQGETVLDLTADGGIGGFSFLLPGEIADEAGGLGDLQVSYALSGELSGLHEGVLSISSVGGELAASTSLSPIFYEELTLSLTFTDQGDSPAQPIGYCSVQFEAQASSHTEVCAVELHRRALLTGSLLATLGLNVFSSVQSPEPVEGATILINGGISGLTGSGSFGTPGYLRRFLHAGEYTVRAEIPGRYGEITVSLDPLAIENRVIFLDQEEESVTCHAAEVLDYSPGPRKDGGAVSADRQHPENALGAPQHTDTVNFVSLGMGGSLTLGFDTPVLNWTGDDLTVVETSYGNPSCSSYPEWVRVYASQTGSAGDWHDLGSTCRTGSFDLGHLESASFFKLVDETDPAQHNNGGDGFDVDGLVGAHCGTP